MNRRGAIDRINSKYRGSAILSPQPIELNNAPIITGTTIRRSTVSPSVLYAGSPSTYLHSALQPAPQTLVSGLPSAPQVVTSGFPLTTNQTYLSSAIPITTNTITRRSRVQSYPSLSGPSIIAPATTVITQPAQIVNRTTQVTTTQTPNVASVVVDDTANLPTPPPIQRRRNRNVDAFRQKGFCDSCPWWLWLILCLLLTGLLLGFLIGFKDTIFGNHKKQVVKTENTESTNGESTNTQNNTSTTTGATNTKEQENNGSNQGTNSGETGTQDSKKEESTTNTDNDKTNGQASSGDNNQENQNKSNDKQNTQDLTPKQTRVTDDGSNLPLEGDNPPTTVEPHVDNKQKITVTNVTCKPGYFFQGNRCISCPEGSYWNGKQCMRRVVDQNPSTTNTKTQVTDNGRNDFEKATNNVKIDVARPWSVIQPSAFDVRGDCLINQINSQAKLSTSTATTDGQTENDNTKTTAEVADDSKKTEGEDDKKTVGDDENAKTTTTTTTTTTTKTSQSEESKKSQDDDEKKNEGGDDDSSKTTTTTTTKTQGGDDSNKTDDDDDKKTQGSDDDKKTQGSDDDKKTQGNDEDKKDNSSESHRHLKRRI